MNDSIGLYLNDIGKVPLLTAEDERELSRIIEAGREAQAQLDATHPAPKRIDTLALAESKLRTMRPTLSPLVMRRKNLNDAIESGFLCTP